MRTGATSRSSRGKGNASARAGGRGRGAPRNEPRGGAPVPVDAPPGRLLASPESWKSLSRNYLNPTGEPTMRGTPRIALATLSGLAIVLALATGCSSRKKVTTAQVEPPPPPPVEQQAETPPPPPAPQPTPEPRISLQDAFFDFDDFSL